MLDMGDNLSYIVGMKTENVSVSISKLCPAHEQMDIEYWEFEWK